MQIPCPVWFFAHRQTELTMDTPSPSPPPRIAVIDLGSNTARCVIFENLNGELREIASDREALKILRSITPGGALSQGASRRLGTTLARFLRTCQKHNATDIHVIATAAYRQASNGPDVLARLSRRTGIPISIVDGTREGTLSLLGALRAFPTVSKGYVIDIGGGSMEIVQFRNRIRTASWCFPLGALRTADAFLTSDPPTDEERTALREHVRSTLSAAAIPALEKDDVVIGVGGSIRNLARINARHHSSIPEPSRSSLRRKDIRTLIEAMTLVSEDQRASIRGLSPDRADSILGGATVLRTTMKFLKAKQLIVSPYGLREGMATEILDASPLSKGTDGIG